jgi:hypothetical protein
MKLGRSSKNMQIWFKYYFILFFFWIPFYLQAVQIHLANGVKLRKNYNEEEFIIICQADQ